MTRTTIGIVDYGIGNHASVRHTLHDLGYRCRVSAEAAALEACDLLLLPGVGAFPPAMRALRTRGLDRFVIDWVGGGRALIGICLGMQLLAQSSDEGVMTPGLGVLPGDVAALGSGRWHIGWNSLDRPATPDDDPLFRASYGHTFYFNHSFVYRGPQEFVAAVTRLGDNRFASAVRRGSVVGMQFHPEKSQASGRVLLRTLLEGLSRAE